MPTSLQFDALPQLDDRDVTFLYEIVSAAQLSNHRPIKALFAAYDSILRQQGADADHESKSFRFLSHAGGQLARGGTKGLVRQFRHILSRLGIQLVLEDGDVAGVDHRPFEDTESLQDLDGFATSRLRRRASFNDSNLDATWASRASQPYADLGSDLRQTRASSDGNRYTHNSASSALPRRAASAARSEAILRDRNAPPPLLLWNERPDKRQLLTEAADFLLGTMARRYMWTWHSRAARIQRRQQDLLQIASNHDRRTLVKQSFLQMRGANFGNRFWHQQEKRAGRARDLFLLTKAFTHWAQAASDEVLRTSLARRHILRTRYFNAWRDISAVNELKCRRVALNKWFHVWSARAELASQQTRLAAEFRRATLLKDCYWKWFWNFCAQKAPVWKDFRSKASILSRWKSSTIRLQEMTLAADGRHNRSLQSGSFSILYGRFLRRQDENTRAHVFERQAMLRRALDTWHRKIHLRPRQVRFNADYHSRLLSKAFVCWQDRVRCSQRAASINAHRVQSHAWTLWNDQLRTQALRMRIDDRIVLEALYRWVLQQRLVLFSRVDDYRRKHLALHHLQSHIAMRRFQLDEATQSFSTDQTTRLVRSAFARLYQQIRSRERLALQATEFRNIRLLPMALTAWKEQTAEARKLDRWAVQARYYCLVHTSVKRWREATLEMQRKRRREAYATVRRRQKTNAARFCLHKLQGYALHCRNLDTEAQRKSDFKLEVVSRSCLDQCLALSQSWRIDGYAAEKISRRNRLQDALDALMSRYQEFQGLYTQASLYSIDGAERAARKVLRKLVNLDFGLRRNIETADAWHDRRSFQRRQAILRHWARRALELRDARIAESRIRTAASNSVLTERHARVEDVGEQTFAGPTVSMLGNVNGQDQSEVDATSATVPGYLRTPFRRRDKLRFRPATARTNASRIAEPLDFGSSVMASTTPASMIPNRGRGGSVMPQVTPFQARMRAGGYDQALSTPLSAAGQTPYGGASGLLLRRLADSRHSDAIGRSQIATNRSVRFAQADAMTFTDEGEQEEAENGDVDGLDESPLRSKS